MVTTIKKEFWILSERRGHLEEGWKGKSHKEDNIWTNKRMVEQRSYR